METEYFGVIMAGGGGTRLWPLSRQEKPKQALRLFGDRTLFQVAVDRILPVMDHEHIYVVTVEEQAKLLAGQVPTLPQRNFVLEPGPRGTASVVGLAALLLSEQHPGCVLAMLTADHYIANVERFQELLLAAYDVAAQGDLVTLGITPDYPDTGYGYIHRGDKRGTYKGFDAYHVRTFKEKPVLAVAEEYLASGEYVWNSGMFVWQADRILQEIERQMPDLFAGLQQISASLGKPNQGDIVNAVWQKLESQTVDYGIMEGAKNVSVIPADDLGWCDVGSWRRLYDLSESDRDGNILEALETLLVDTQGTLVYQERQRTSKRLITTLGVKDLIVVDTEDVLLVCAKDQAERVRELVKLLEAKGQDNYL